MVVGHLDIEMQAEAQPLPHAQKLTQNGDWNKSKKYKTLRKKTQGFTTLDLARFLDLTPKQLKKIIDWVSSKPDFMHQRTPLGKWWDKATERDELSAITHLRRVYHPKRTHLMDNKDRCPRKWARDLAGISPKTDQTDEKWKRTEHIRH